MVRLTSGSAPLGGTFTLSLDGKTTAPIAFDASQFAVRDALQAVDGAGDVSVTTSRHLDGGTTWRVTFYSRIGDVPALVANTSALTGRRAAVTVAEYRKGTALSKTFQLVVGGDGASPARVLSETLPHDASPSAVRDGDFRLLPGSPAYQLGFQDTDLTQDVGPDW